MLAHVLERIDPEPVLKLPWRPELSQHVILPVDRCDKFREIFRELARGDLWHQNAASRCVHLQEHVLGRKRFHPARVAQFELLQTCNLKRWPCLPNPPNVLALLEANHLCDQGCNFFRTDVAILNAGLRKVLPEAIIQLNNCWEHAAVCCNIFLVTVQLIILEAAVHKARFTSQIFPRLIFVLCLPFALPVRFGRRRPAPVQDFVLECATLAVEDEPVPLDALGLQWHNQVGHSATGLQLGLELLDRRCSSKPRSLCCFLAVIILWALFPPSLRCMFFSFSLRSTVVHKRMHPSSSSTAKHLHQGSDQW